jgi:hypothetical protein
VSPIPKGNSPGSERAIFSSESHIGRCFASSVVSMPDVHGATS